MDTDSGINDNRLKLDSIAHSSRGEQAHFFKQSYTNGISYKSNIFVSKSIRHFSCLNLVRKFVLSKFSFALCKNLMKINVLLTDEGPQ